MLVTLDLHGHCPVTPLQTSTCIERGTTQTDELDMLPVASHEHGWHPRGLLAFKLKNLVAQIDEKEE